MNHSHGIFAVATHHAAQLCVHDGCRVAGARESPPAQAPAITRMATLAGSGCTAEQRCGAGAMKTSCAVSAIAHGGVISCPSFSAVHTNPGGEDSWRPRSSVGPMKPCLPPGPPCEPAVREPRACVRAQCGGPRAAAARARRILSMQAGEKFHFPLLRQLNSQDCSSCCSGQVSFTVILWCSVCRKFSDRH
jgi:hypothetical protein